MLELVDLVGIINININPVLIDTGGFELTWHGLFTAVGIALGVWLSVRLARRARISEDDAMSIAVVSVLSGIVGARLLWVIEHTDQIGSVGDIFALTDGGISIYGAMIGGVLGGFLYVTFFKPNFPKWVALDVAAPGMILGQAVGRFGDVINGEHFANASDLPWAFRYNPSSDRRPLASAQRRRLVSRLARSRGRGAGRGASGRRRLRADPGLHDPGRSVPAASDGCRRGLGIHLLRVWLCDGARSIVAAEDG